MQQSNNSRITMHLIVNDMCTVPTTLTFQFFQFAYREVVTVVIQRKRLLSLRFGSCLACSQALIRIEFLKEDRILYRA
jgi:hypothetical protein